MNKEDIIKALEEFEQDKEGDNREDVRPPNPFKITVRKPESTDEYTTVSQIKGAYSDNFVVEAVHNDVHFKFLCNRIPLFELLPDQLDREASTTTFKMAYEDAINVIFGTVLMPQEEQLTFDDIANLPVMLVLRINNAILDEISPGFGFRVEEKEEEEDEESLVEEEIVINNV